MVSLVLYGVIQVLHNAVGRGRGGVDFPEKKVSQVYVISITRGWVDGEPGGCPICRRKALRNT